MFSDPRRGQFPVRPELRGEADMPADVRAMETDWQAVSKKTSPFSRKAAEILK